MFKKKLIPKAPSTIDNLIAHYNGTKKERVESELLLGQGRHHKKIIAAREQVRSQNTSGDAYHNMISSKGQNFFFSKKEKQDRILDDLNVRSETESHNLEQKPAKQSPSPIREECGKSGLISSSPSNFEARIETQLAKIRSKSAARVEKERSRILRTSTGAALDIQPAAAPKSHHQMIQQSQESIGEEDHLPPPTEKGRQERRKNRSK